MPQTDGQDEGQLREIAYFLWLDEGCPEGRADDHWMMACGMLSVSLPATGEQDAGASAPAADPRADTPVVPKGPAKH